MRVGAQGETRSTGEAPSEQGWLARLALRFDRPAGRTVLRRNAHVGPLRVQRPFFPEGDRGPCHVYLLHPPGGVVGSDRIELSVHAEAGAHAVLTTPGAGKFYRTRGPRAFMAQRVEASGGARVELLPQETIVFDGADARLDTRVDVQGGGSSIGWDLLCLGRPAANEAFTRGSVRQRLEIRRDGELRFVERAQYLGGSRLLQAAWGLGGQPVVGLFWCTSAGPALLSALREACRDHAHVVAFSQVGDVMVGRCIAPSTGAARAAFEAAWRATRLHLDGRTPHAPRIWNT